jgi:hypothetical protein
LVEPFGADETKKMLFAPDGGGFKNLPSVQVHDGGAAEVDH